MWRNSEVVLRLQEAHLLARLFEDEAHRLASRPDALRRLVRFADTRAAQLMHTVDDVLLEAARRRAAPAAEPGAADRSALAGKPAHPPPARSQHVSKAKVLFRTRVSGYHVGRDCECMRPRKSCWQSSGSICLTAACLPQCAGALWVRVQMQSLRRRQQVQRRPRRANRRRLQSGRACGGRHLRAPAALGAGMAARREHETMAATLTLKPYAKGEAAVGRIGLQALLLPHWGACQRRAGGRALRSPASTLTAVTAAGDPAPGLQEPRPYSHRPPHIA